MAGGSGRRCRCVASTGSPVTRPQSCCRPACRWSVGCAPSSTLGRSAPSTTCSRSRVRPPSRSHPQSLKRHWLMAMFLSSCHRHDAATPYRGESRPAAPGRRRDLSAEVRPALRDPHDRPAARPDPGAAVGPPRQRHRHRGPRTGPATTRNRPSQTGRHDLQLTLSTSQQGRINVARPALTCRQHL